MDDRNELLGPPTGSPMSSRSTTNPVENISDSTTRRAPSEAARRTSGASAAKFASRSAQTMSCCTAATRMSSVFHLPADSRSAAAVMVGSCLQKANRTMWRPSDWFAGE